MKLFNKELKKQVVSFSGGKDSTAMLFNMIERGENISHIIFADTEAEFPELYEYINKINKITVEKIGIPITIVKSKKSLNKWMEGLVTRGKNKYKVRGFPLVASPCYWQRESKYKPIYEFIKDNKIKNYEMCVGIASDELKRISKNKEKEKIRYPLIEWGWSEQDCFNYLNDLDLQNNLYHDFKRIGCYFCPKQSEYSLYIVWKNYKKQWQKLKDLNEFQKNIKESEIILTYKLKTFSEWEKKFENGYIPEKKFITCFDCKGFKAIVTRQRTLDEFENNN